MDIDRLLVLEFLSKSETCVRELSEVSYDLLFEVDEEMETYSFDKWSNVPIGKARPEFDAKGGRYDGIIGVYNPDSYGHMKNMVRDSNRFLNSRKF